MLLQVCHAQDKGLCKNRTTRSPSVTSPTSVTGPRWTRVFTEFVHHAVSSRYFVFGMNTEGTVSYLFDRDFQMRSGSTLRSCRLRPNWCTSSCVPVFYSVTQYFSRLATIAPPRSLGRPRHRPPPVSHHSRGWAAGARPGRNRDTEESTMPSYEHHHPHANDRASARIRSHHTWSLMRCAQTVPG